MMFKYYKTKCKGLILSWFYSGKYWYVTSINKNGDRLTKKTPVGSGNSRDLAYIDFNSQQGE